MWPFDRAPTEGRPQRQAVLAAPERPTPSGPELAELGAAVKALGARIDGIEKAHKALDTEWTGWYDKFRRLYARIAKRAEREEDREDAAETVQDAPSRANGAGSGANYYPRGLSAPETPRRRIRGF